MPDYTASHVIYRGSLQTSCDIGSKIRIKQKLISTEYLKEMYFYGMKEESCSKYMGSFSYLDIPLATKMWMYCYIFKVYGLMCYVTFTNNCIIT